MPNAFDDIDNAFDDIDDDLTGSEMLSGGADIAGAVGTNLLRSAVEIPTRMGGMVMGKSPQENLAATGAMMDKVPQWDIGESGKKVIQALSEKYKTSPDFIQEIVNDFMGLSQSVGDFGFEKTGSPAVGAALSVLPVALESASMVRAPKAIAQEVAGISKGYDRKIADLESPSQQELTNQQLNQGQSDLPIAPTEEGMAQVSQRLKTGTPEEIALDVSPDPSFYKASDELGINTEPLASFASQNPQYRAIEQGLASFPASQLDTQAKAYIADVAQSADDLITRYGGTLDKAELSSRFQEDSLRTIDDIYDAESQLYDAIDASLPGQTRVKPDNILSFIESKISKSGGIKAFAKQNPRLMKMYNQLKPKTGGKPKMDVVMGAKAQSAINPTYEVLNDIRREVGQQLGRKGDTSFKNTETGLLKAIYGRLKEDQNSIARTLENGEALLKQADAHTIQRKQLEDNLSTLLGKKLQKDLMPVLGKAIKGLAPATGRVDFKTFKNTINAIPEKFRAEAMVSALNDIFRGASVDGQAFDATQFTKFMNQLDRSPESKALLYNTLPTGAAKSLDNLRKVAKGISVAQADRVTTGRISAMFDENDGLLKKLMKSGVSLAATKMAGPLAGMGVGELLKNASDSAKSTNTLLASPAFQATIRSAVSEGVIEGGKASRKLQLQETALAKSKAYKDWSKTLDESASAKLTSLGIVGYLLSSEDNKATKEPQ